MFSKFDCLILYLFYLFSVRFHVQPRPLFLCLRMETSSKKTAYNNKLAEIKEKYFPLLEKLIKTEKAEKFQAVYTALKYKR